MVAAGLQFLLSAGVIVIAGTALTRFADAIADLTGLGRLLVGSIFLAAATSLPELSVSFSAVWQAAPNLAVGDLMGASLFNLLIVGVLDLSRQSRGRMLSRMSAAHALSATMSISLMALAAIGVLSRLDVSVAGMGVNSPAIVGAYLLGVRFVYYDQRLAAKELAASSEEPPIGVGRLTLGQAVAGFVLSAAAIILAAPFLADAAGRLAELTGLGNTFLGTTFGGFLNDLAACRHGGRRSAGGF